MSKAALVIGGPRDRQVALINAFAAHGYASMSVPDAVAAMAALGRADFRALIIADAEKANHVSLHGLCRIAQMRHPGVAAVVLVRPGASSKVAEGVNAVLLSDDTSATVIAARAAERVAENDELYGNKGEDDPFEDPTLVDTSTPALLEGELGEGAGAALLVTFFSQELTGKLEIGPGPAEGALWFLNGEPVAADDPRGDEGLFGRLLLAGVIEHGMVPDGLVEGRLVQWLKDSTISPDKVVNFMKFFVRDRVLALVDQSGGHWAFFEDKAFVEGRTITKLNPFGLILEARRRRMPPASVLEVGAQIESQYVLPEPGLDRAAPKLGAFVRGRDLAPLVTGLSTTKQLLDETGMDPLMGTLVVLTLQDTRLVTLADAPRARTGVRLTELRAPTNPALAAATLDPTLPLTGSPAPPTLEEPSPFAEPAPPAQSFDEKTESLPAPKIGRYEVLDLIGRGGMAEVHLGRQIFADGFEKRVVIKRILREFAKDEEFVAMFLDEARVSARISHPNVVQVIDLGKDGDDPYIVLELVQGADLDSLIQACPPSEPFMPFEIAARIVADAAAGLHAAHSWIDERGRPSPIIHRDVSPQNLLVSIDGHVKLTDFGVAKAAGMKARTLPGQRKGKLPYSAPEYLNGGPATVLSDVFSLGIVLYQCLVKDHPFARSNVATSMDAIMSGDLVPVRARRPGVPPELDAIVTQALAVDPGRRHEDASAMQNALETFISEYGRSASSAFVAHWVERVLPLVPAAGKKGVKPPKKAPAAARAEQPLSLDAMADLMRAASKTENGPKAPGPDRRRK